MSNTPSDAEIDEVTLDVLGYAALDKETNETARMIARAVLAKWGTPQPVVREPLPKFTALRFRARRDKKAEVTLLFQGHETADAWVRGITKKGGSNAE